LAAWQLDANNRPLPYHQFHLPARRQRLHQTFRSHPTEHTATGDSAFNSLSLTASAIEKIGGVPNIATEAQSQLEKAQKLWGSIELLNNHAKEGDWDWFLSFDSVLESTNEKFHTEIYFKASQTHYYIVKLSFAEADRDAYPWKEVVETFTIS
jgi:hypothetical protein